MSAPVMMPEQWRPVVGFEGIYDVSDFGRVRSLARVVCGQPGQAMNIAGGLMKPAPDRDGYDAVRLSRDGYGRSYRVHLLIVEAFIGPREDPEHEARHLNGSRRANGLANLAWGTARDNVQDMLRHGRHNMQVKQACPLAHRLVAPNLVEAALRRGKRNCRACRQAHDVVRRATNSGVTPPDFTTLAHERYRLIMKEAT